MTTSTTRRGSGRPSAARLGAVLAFTTMMGGMVMYPASADGGHGHHGRGDRGNRGDDHDRGHWRHRYDRNDWRGGPVYEPYPVYAPPPVYYAPEPSSGVSLFFPIHIR